MKIIKYPENYFGINDTYNVFNGGYIPKLINDLYYQIPNIVNIEGEEWVVVNTGYVALDTTETSKFEFEICDTNGTSLQKLELVRGVLLSSSSMPLENQIVWFNDRGLNGSYYINSKWLGKVLHLIRGEFIGTTVSNAKIYDLTHERGIIADEEEHPTGTYYYNADGAKKPIYYRMFQKEYMISHEVIGNISEWAVDKILKNTFLKRWGGNSGIGTWQGNDSVSVGGTDFGGFQTASTNYNSNGDITINLGMSNRYGYGWNGIKHLYFEYTKTTDSLEY